MPFPYCSHLRAVRLLFQSSPVYYSNNRSSIIPIIVRLKQKNCEPINVQLVLIHVQTTRAAQNLFSQLLFHLLFTTERKDGVPWSGIRYTSTLDRKEYNIVVPASYKQQEPPTKDAISDFIAERFKPIRQYKMGAQ